MKKHLLLFLFVTAVLAQTIHAAETSPRVGKQLYDRVCRVCHVKDTQAGELKPSSKTMQEWRDTIKKNKHRCDPQVLRSLTAEDKEALIEFLKTYASDYNY